MSWEFEQPDPEPPSQTPNGRRRWREGIAWGTREIVQGLALAVTAAIFLPVAALVIAAMMGIDVIDSSGGLTDAGIETGIVASLPFEAVLFAVVVVLAIFKCRSRWSDLGFRPLALGQAWVPAAVVIGSFAVYLTYVAIADAIGGDKFLPDDPLGDVLDKKAFVVLTGILALAMAPVAEEMFFRGFLFGGLANRFSLITAALVSGFLFALAHQQPTLLIPFTLVGMLFAAGYAYTGSLWTTIAAHFTFNLISFTITLATR